MLGCPYNFYPEKPWLRRTIRGVIATSVFVASPIIVASAVAAAVTVLPPFGIYKLVKHARARRRANAAANFPIGTPFLIDTDLLDPPILPNPPFRLDIPDDYDAIDMMRAIREHINGLSFTPIVDEGDTVFNESPVNLDFPLSIFSDMDVEYLVSCDKDKEEPNNSPSDFRTCPTTPNASVRKGLSQSMHNITVTHPSSINRYHSMTSEH